jgi:hypothetical protein
MEGYRRGRSVHARNPVEIGLHQTFTTTLFALAINRNRRS